MIQLTDNLSLDRDKYNWILCDTRTVLATKGKQKGQMVERTSCAYYGKLHQALTAALENLVREFTDGPEILGVRDLLSAIEGAEQRLVARMSGDQGA